MTTCTPRALALPLSFAALGERAPGLGPAMGWTATRCARSSRPLVRTMRAYRLILLPNRRPPNAPRR